MNIKSLNDLKNMDAKALEKMGIKVLNADSFAKLGLKVLNDSDFAKLGIKVDRNNQTRLRQLPDRNFMTGSPSNARAVTGEMGSVLLALALAFSALIVTCKERKLKPSTSRKKVSFEQIPVSKVSRKRT